jgi:hypothetical protein
MKTTSLREFRGQVTTILDGDEAVLVTRRGKPAGVLYPFTDPDKLPREIRQTLFLELSSQIAKDLKVRGVSEEALQRDFRESRRTRRRGQ